MDGCRGPFVQGVFLLVAVRLISPGDSCLHDYPILAVFALISLAGQAAMTMTWFYLLPLHIKLQLYTSGSTGKPKGVVHSTGGYMVNTYATVKVSLLLPISIFCILASVIYTCRIHR